MSTETINIKVDTSTKKEAQQLAKSMGLSLSAVLKGYLHHFLTTKTVHFSAAPEIPSQYLLDALKRSDEDIKAGRYARFTSAKEAIAWLHDDSEAKYENGDLAE